MELVLVLPVLLFMMALMINFGSASVWKTRALTAARQGVWRDRAGRNGGADPNPPEWPAQSPTNAKAGSTGAAELNSVRSSWDEKTQPFTFIRGPVVGGTSPQTGLAGRIELQPLGYLDIPAGVKQGTSDITRTPTLLPKTRKYSYHLKHPLVDNQWQFFTMGYQNGKADVIGGANYARRSYYWYGFDDGHDWFAEQLDFRQADSVMQSNPSAGQLTPLDRDLVLFGWFGDFQDFYPRFPRSCVYNLENLQREEVDPFISRIQGPTGGGRGGVPFNMAVTWIGYYEQQLGDLNRQLQNAPAGAREAISAQIDAINAVKKKYEDFRDSLN